jgi:hypothetical protein
MQGKDKVGPISKHYAMKMYGGVEPPVDTLPPQWTRCIDPCFLGLGTSWR